MKLGTLLESYWSIAGLLEPDEPLLERGETLLEPHWNLVVGNSGWNMLLGTNAGVDFVVLFTFLLLLMCRVVRLEVWLELCWNRVATLLEPILGQLLVFLGRFFPESV